METCDVNLSEEALDEIRASEMFKLGDTDYRNKITTCRLEVNIETGELIKS